MIYTPPENIQYRPRKQTEEVIISMAKLYHTQRQPIQKEITHRNAKDYITIFTESLFDREELLSELERYISDESQLNNRR